jgi:hypothetical protein
MDGWNGWVGSWIDDLSKLRGDLPRVVKKSKNDDTLTQAEMCVIRKTAIYGLLDHTRDKNILKEYKLHKQQNTEETGEGNMERITKYTLNINHKV